MPRFRNIVFTLNNPTDDETAQFRSYLTQQDAREEHYIQYIVLQTERGENNTIHYQGYIEFSRQRSQRQVKNVNQRMHFERRRGTQAQAIAYSQKEDTRVDGLSGEAGTKKKPVKTFNEIALSIQNGATIDEIEDDAPGSVLLNRNKIEDYFLKQKGKRSWACKILIYVGPTRSGKSWWARQHEDNYVVPWPVGGRWWMPGYLGQYRFIMDEFRHQIKYDTLLQLFDRYEFTCESKGRNFHFCSKEIVVTTNIDPSNWYPNLSAEAKAPLQARINEFAEIWDFTGSARWNGETLLISMRRRSGDFSFSDRVIDENDDMMDTTPGQNFNFGRFTQNVNPNYDVQ